LIDFQARKFVCQRSAEYIAQMIKEGLNTPFIRVSLYGIGQTSEALRKTAACFGLEERAEQVIAEEVARVEQALSFYRSRLASKRVAVYVGGPRV
jgi:nitrogenase molybdenum-iron protein alpha chain